MNNFELHNPTKLVFGKGQIAKLSTLISTEEKILLVYGGGSIKKNGVYEQVKNALSKHSVIEFGGVEANPQYTTLNKAIALGKEENITYLLSIGGGSVLDGTKFIAAGLCYEGDTWDFILKKAVVEKAIPIGAVLTLPAAGSEMNGNAVISRKEIGQKRPFSSKLVYPQFSILDPETSYSLSERQVGNGIVDAFTHVLEQYLTYPADAPLQDRIAESVLKTLTEEGPKAYNNSTDYTSKATVMWCATMALNGIISAGVPQDWSTHMIGHEITAIHGIDHARTLAIVLPGVLRRMKQNKKEKLLQFGERVWGITQGTEEERIEQAILQTEVFFQSVGVPTRLKGYDLGRETIEKVVENLNSRNVDGLGEHNDMDTTVVKEALELVL